MEEKVLSLEDKVEDLTAECSQSKKELLYVEMQLQEKGKITAECTKAKKAVREISYLRILLDNSRGNLTTVYCKNQTLDTEVKDKYTTAVTVLKYLYLYYLQNSQITLTVHEYSFCCFCPRLKLKLSRRRRWRIKSCPSRRRWKT